MTKKYQTGGFVFYRASSLQPAEPGTVQAEAIRLGLDPAIVPQYAGDRQAVSRAIGQVNAGLSRQGWELTSIKTSRHEVVYGISAVHRNQAAERVDFDFESRLRWTDEHGNGQAIDGQHAIARRVDACYQSLRDRIVAADWTHAITDYLTGPCQATAVRDDGRIYWVPPHHIPAVLRFGELLASVGIALMCCEIEAEAQTIVTQVAGESLAAQLDTLEAEAAQFDGTQRPSTYKLRLEQYRGLRARAITYREALGIGVEKAEAVLSRLEAEVGYMLDLRQQTTIPRPTPGRPAPGDPAPAGEPAIPPDPGPERFAEQYTPLASVRAESPASLSFNF